MFLILFVVRVESNRFEGGILKDLRLRFERPIEKNRWDCPLFHVNMSPRAPEHSTPVSVHSTSSDRGETGLTNEGGDSDSTQASAAKSAAPTTVFRRTAFKKSTAVTTSGDPTYTGVDSSEVNTIMKDQQTESASKTCSAAAIGLSISGSYTERAVLSGGLPSEQVMVSIGDYLDTAVAPAPNSSTIPKVHASADLLYQLDQVSQTIVQAVIAHQKEAVVEGTPLVFSEYNRSIVIHRFVGISELQRHRRQFVKVNTMHPPASGIDVGAAFVDFLAKQL